MSKDRIFKMCSRKYINMATAVLIAISVVIINIAAGVLSDKIPLSADLTANKAYKLSQDTKDYLKEFQYQGEIIVLSDENTLATAGNYYAQAKAIIDNMAIENKNLKLSYINPIKNPGIVSRYSNLSPEMYDIIVSVGEKSEKLSLNSLFEIGYNAANGQQYVAASKAEQEIISSLVRLTATSSSQIAFITGYGEEYPQGLEDLFTKNGYEVCIENITTISSLSDRYSGVFVFATKRDMEANDVKKLESFLENNGDYGKTLFFAPLPTAPQLPNLEIFLSQWGININDGIVMETAADRILNNTPYYCLTDYKENTYLKNSDISVPFVSLLGKNITAAFDKKDGYKTITLAEYSTNSFVLPSEVEEDWNPTKDDLGSRPAVLEGTFTGYSGKDLVTGSIITFPSSTSFESALLTSTAVSNGEFLISILNSKTDKKTNVVIAPKSLDWESISITKMQIILIAIVFIAVLPLSVTVLGITVWLKRKRR